MKPSLSMISKRKTKENGILVLEQMASQHRVTLEILIQKEL